jgi:outer membrane receptor for ferrienterochelin and colicin
VRYCSGQFEDDLNQRRLQDYVSVDAMLTRQIGKGREVFLGIENLTDTEIQSRRDADGTIGITNPRSWTAGVRCEF